MSVFPKALVVPTNCQNGNANTMFYRDHQFWAVKVEVARFCVNAKRIKHVSSFWSFTKYNDASLSIDTPFVRIKDVKKSEPKKQLNDQQSTQRNPEHGKGFNCWPKHRLPSSQIGRDESALRTHFVITILFEVEFDSNKFINRGLVTSTPYPFPWLDWWRRFVIYKRI